MDYERPAIEKREAVTSPVIEGNLSIGSGKRPSPIWKRESDEHGAASADE